MKKEDQKKIAIVSVATVGAAVIGSLFTTPAITTWYSALVKPSFNPPNVVFGPAWTLLYFAMGLAAVIIWRSKNKPAKIKQALYWYWAQLIANALWSIIFFGLHDPYKALYCILALWFLILMMMIRFWRLSEAAGLLILPYLTWVSFATVLNFAIWALN